jgi:hypothetical protein
MSYYDSTVTYDSTPPAFYDETVPPTKKAIMARIRLDAQKLVLPLFVQRCQRVATMMAGNTNFTSISGKVTAFTAALTTLTTASAAYETARQQADQKLTERDDAVRALQDEYRQLASAAEGVTMDAAELEGGGWELRGQAAPLGQVAAPGNLSARFGQMAGSVDLDWSRVRGAASYVLDCAPNPNGPWTRAYEGTRAGCTLSGLTSGSLYYFRVAAIAANGLGPWSDIAEKRAA